MEMAVIRQNNNNNNNNMHLFQPRSDIMKETNELKYSVPKSNTLISFQGENENNFTAVSYKALSAGHLRGYISHRIQISWRSAIISKQSVSL